MILTVFGLPALFVATVFFATSATIVARIRPRSRLIPWIIRNWGRTFLFVTGTRVTVTGADRLDPEASYVFTGNHTSNLDIPVLLGRLPSQIRFLAKAELFGVPILGPAMRAVHMVETNRTAGPAAHRAINSQVRTVIGEGLSLAIFPEGTRSRDGSLMAFKKGAFRIAVDSEIAIVPITILGASRAWPAGNKIVYGGRIELVIHEPISTAGLARDGIDALRDRARETVGAPLD